MPERRGDGPRRVVDHFAVLGLTPEATDADIRRAYRGKARDSHPDRGGDAQEFARISAAYEALRGPGAREHVALELRVQARRDEMVRGQGRGRGPTATAGPTARPAPAGRAPGPAAPPSRPGPGGPRRPASRLSHAEQDRLIDEFLRSHPEARPRAGSTPAAGPPRGGRPGRPSRPDRARPGRRRGRVRRLLLGLLAVVALGVVAQPLLPDPVQEQLSGWVEVVSP